jgi:hypothetical protein
MKHGLSREAIERMSDRERHPHADALAGLEPAARQLLGDQLDQEAEEGHRLPRLPTGP